MVCVPKGTLYPIHTYGLCSKVVHYIGTRVPFGTQPNYLDNRLSARATKPAAKPSSSSVGSVHWGPGSFLFFLFFLPNPLFLTLKHTNTNRRTIASVDRVHLFLLEPKWAGRVLSRVLLNEGTGRTIEYGHVFLRNHFMSDFKAPRGTVLFCTELSKL